MKTKKRARRSRRKLGGSQSANGSNSIEKEEADIQRYEKLIEEKNDSILKYTEKIEKSGNTPTQEYSGAIKSHQTAIRQYQEMIDKLRSDIEKKRKPLHKNQNRPVLLSDMGSRSRTRMTQSINFRNEKFLKNKENRYKEFANARNKIDNHLRNQKY
jgi:flagellar biosynthesis chaperone FliJ